MGGKPFQSSSSSTGCITVVPFVKVSAEAVEVAAEDVVVRPMVPPILFVLLLLVEPTPNLRPSPPNPFEFVFVPLLLLPFPNKLFKYDVDNDDDDDDDVDADVDDDDKNRTFEFNRNPRPNIHTHNVSMISQMNLKINRIPFHIDVNSVMTGDEEDGRCCCR